MLKSDKVSIYPTAAAGIRALDGDDGMDWTIINISDSVRFSMDKGPWLSLSKKQSNTKLIWVHAIHDKLFKVIPSN